MNLESSNSHTLWDDVLRTHLHSSSNNTAFPPLHGMKPPKNLPYNKWVASATSLGKYCPMQGLPFIFTLTVPQYPPHTLTTQAPDTPYLPYNAI